MATPKITDNDVLNKYILLGLLLGGGTALATTAVRTSKLNRKLKEYSNPKLESDENAIVIPVSRKTAMDKSAEVPAAYKLTALAGAGVISYAALSALYRRLEDNRMKALEKEVYDKAVSRIAGSGAEKSAQDHVLENLGSIKNVAVLLALLGSAALVKKRLDRDNVDSEKLKPVRAGNVILRDASLNRGPEKQAASGALASPVTGVSSKDPNYASIVRIRRILHENPEAAKLLTGNALDAAGYGKLNFLQNIPVVGKWIQNLVLKKLNLGSSYRPGWDPESEVNSFGPPKKLPRGIGRDEAAEYGVGLVRKEILQNKKLRESLIQNIAEQKKLNGWAQAYLRHNPDKLLDRIGITASPGKVMIPEKRAGVKNNVANSYFV